MLNLSASRTAQAGQFGGAGRVLAIDAARGFAMLLVCLSHFATYAPSAAATQLDWLNTIAMIASPTFMLMSGVTIGLLYATQPAAFERTRTRLMDRGLFLLTIGHLAILGSFALAANATPRDLHRTVITDAIGIAVIIAALVVPRLSPGRRLALALGLYVASFALVFMWYPTAAWLRLVRDAMVGPEKDAAMLVNSFPVLPWVAVHLVATVVGEWLGRQVRAGRSDAVVRMWLSAGACALGVAVVLKGIYFMAQPADMTAAWWNVYSLTTPFAKRPPGPVYLLVFGGLGMMLTGAIVAGGRVAGASRVLAGLADFGKASLFIFVVQFYVYNVVLPRIPSSYGSTVWPASFTISIVLLWALARWWNRHVGSGVLTVGLHRVMTARGVRRGTRGPASAAPIRVPPV